MMRQRGVLDRARITLIGSMIGGALAVTSEILCARYLGTRTYGIYALALIMARAGETISVWGLQIATLRYLSIYLDQNDRRYVLGTIGASLLLPLLVGSALATLLWVCAPALAHGVFGNDGATSFIRAMALSIPLLGLTEVMGIITRGFGKAGYYVVIRNVVPPVSFFGLVLLITLVEADPLSIAGAFCVSYLMATFVGVACILKVGGPDLIRQKPLFPFLDLYKYALPILLNTLLYLALSWTNILILGAMHNEEQVGVFRACFLFVMPFTMIMVAFNAAVGHLYPLLSTPDRREELAALTDKTTRWMSALVLGGLLVIALNRHDLLRLMGPDFRSGGDALLVLALGQTVMVYGSNAGYLLMLSGRQNVELLNAFVGAALNIALCVAWIPTYGSVGAAAASSVAVVVISVLRFVQVERLMRVHTVVWSYVGTLAPAILTAVLIWSASSYLNLGEGSGTMYLLIRILLTLSIFGVGVLAWEARGPNIAAARQALGFSALIVIRGLFRG
jgi:O-antigen/teichoic acid export membrane protein